MLFFFCQTLEQMPLIGAYRLGRTAISRRASAAARNVALGLVPALRAAYTVVYSACERALENFGAVIALARGIRGAVVLSD